MLPLLACVSAPKSKPDAPEPLQTSSTRGAEDRSCAFPNSEALRGHTLAEVSGSQDYGEWALNRRLPAKVKKVQILKLRASQAPECHSQRHICTVLTSAGRRGFRAHVSDKVGGTRMKSTVPPAHTPFHSKVLSFEAPRTHWKKSIQKGI